MRADVIAADVNARAPGRGVVYLMYTCYALAWVLLVAVVIQVASKQVLSTAELVRRVAWSAPLTVAPSLVAFLAADRWVYPALFIKRQTGLGGVLLLAAVAASAATGTLALFAIVRLRPSSTAIEFGSSAVVLSLLALAQIAAAVVMRGFRDRFQEAHAREVLARRQQDTELALLRSKIDPHFLFNTLNNIDTMILRAPERASQYLQHLSDIMRFVLYESQDDVVPLASELAYVERYVALERLRSTEPSFVSLELPHEVPHTLFVMPLTIIPWIENAFKHTPSRSIPRAVEIGVTVEGTRLSLRCSNRAVAGHEPSARGVGKELMQRRLALAYGERHRLTATQEHERYTVNLEVDLEHHALRHR